jgi:hypothetical protein
MTLDLLRLGWLGTVTFLLVHAFGAGRLGVRRDSAARIALVARAIVVIVVAVNVLTRLHVFNALTLTCACLAWPVVRWLKRDGWAAEHAFRTAIRRCVLDIVIRVEQPGWCWRPIRRLRHVRLLCLARARLTRRRMEQLSPVELAVACAAASAFSVAVYLRFAPVLGEPRLGNPALYASLLAARQALFNAPSGLVPVLSAVAASLGTASSLHTLHVIRFLGPTVGLAIIVASALLVRRTMRSPAAGLITLAIVAALTPQWSLGDFEIAVLFAIFAALSIAYRSPASRQAVAACIAVSLMAAAGADVRQNAAHLLPVFGGIAAGVAYAGLATFIRRARSIRLDPAAAPIACAALLVLLPRTPGGLFLEYPAAQARTLEIASTLPRGKWLIVAPVEQLAEAYGRGWYEDAAGFVERYALRAGDRSFHFDFAVSDVLVFVEKSPVKKLRAEATAVPFSALADPTYRHYRSLAGRASLQARLLRLCADYSSAHDGASIYYEDDDLTIFRFRLDD